MISWVVGLSVVVAIVGFLLTLNRSSFGWLAIAAYAYGNLAFGYFLLIAFGLIEVYPSWLQPIWLGISPSEVIMIAAFLGAFIGYAKEWWIGVLALAIAVGLAWAIQYRLSMDFLLPTAFLLSSFVTAAGLVVRDQDVQRPTDLQTIVQDIVAKAFLGMFAVLLVLYGLWLMMYLAGGHL